MLTKHVNLRERANDANFISEDLGRSPCDAVGIGIDTTKFRTYPMGLAKVMTDPYTTNVPPRRQ